MIYGHDRCYEGGNLASRVSQRLMDWLDLLKIDSMSARYLVKNQCVMQERSTSISCSLKNKIVSISKELDLISKENISLKNDFDSHVCHATIDSSSIDKNTTPLLLQQLKMIFVYWRIV